MQQNWKGTSQEKYKATVEKCMQRKVVTNQLAKYVGTVAETRQASVQDRGKKVYKLTKGSKKGRKDVLLHAQKEARKVESMSA